MDSLESLFMEILFYLSLSFTISFYLPVFVPGVGRLDGDIVSSLNHFAFAVLPSVFNQSSLGPLNCVLCFPDSASVPWVPPMISA